MPEVLWYYAKNDQQLGPISPAELKQLAATRALAPEDLIWREGMESWAPAAKVKGLFPESREASMNAAAVVSNGPTETMHPAVLGEAPGTADPATSQTPTNSGVPADVFAQQVVAPATAPRPVVNPVESSAAETQRGWEMTDLMWLAQVLLWGISVAVVFVGGLLFTSKLVNAEGPAHEAAIAAVFSTFFIATYILARAGERVAALIQLYFERKRRP